MFQKCCCEFYKGPRSLLIGDKHVDILPAKAQIRVVGVNFSFNDGTGQQAKDLLARARAAAMYHQDLLTADGPWGDKARLLQTLVFGTLAWCAGAVHWNQTVPLAFNLNLKRRPSQSWVAWNQRTCRQVRV